MHGSWVLRVSGCLVLGVLMGRPVSVGVHDRDQAIRLYAQSPTRFFELVENTDLEFTKDASGSVTGFVVNGSLKATRQD